MGTCLDLTGFQRGPVDATELWVGQDILRASYHISQPLGTVGVEECANEVTGERIDMCGPGNPATKDLFVDAKGVVAEEGLHINTSMCRQNKCAQDIQRASHSREYRMPTNPPPFRAHQNK